MPQWYIDCFKLKSVEKQQVQERQIDGETMKQLQILILGAPKSLQMVIAAMKLKDACSLEEKL